MTTSVALCTFNGEKYISEQIESILNQTSPIDEIVVCDDGSTDKTIDILNDYQTKYPSVFKIFKNEENLGFIKNFEKAILLCTQDIILLSDQDDVWETNKVEVLKNEFLQNPEKDLIVHNLSFNSSEIPKKYTFWDYKSFNDKIRKGSNDEILEFVLTDGNLFPGMSIALRERFVNNFLPFLTYDKLLLHDSQIIIRGLAKNKVLISDKILGKYRLHEEQNVGNAIINRIKSNNFIRPLSFYLKREAAFRETMVRFGLAQEYRDAFERQKRNAKKIKTQNNSMDKIKNLAKHYLNKAYVTAKALYFVETKKAFEKKDSVKPMVIYTNGKVGSSTIYKSIEKNTNHPVFHIHHLNKNYLSGYEKFVKENYFRKPERGNYLWQSLLWRPLFLRKNLLYKKPLKFIIVWRDPIAKNISTFFEWIKFREDDNFFYFHSHQYEMQFDIKTPKDDLSLLIEHFLKYFPHHIHENWLEIEQNEVLNIPFLQYDFDKETNYQIIKNELNEVLTLKLEHFKNENYPKIIGDFCGMQDFKYENANVTKDKPKNKPYELFLEQIRIPSKLLNQIYCSDFMNHFYNDWEIDGFINKWTKQSKIK